jgi:acyl-CoA synthetase (AMP-forming)/AMP-acid ligase II
LDIPNPILHDLIMASVQQHGPKVAMVCKHQPADLIPAVRRLGIQNKRSTVPPYLCWTHAQLQHGADLLAVGLLKSGFQIGSTIAVILSGRAEFHMALRAAVKLKSPFTPIHPRSAHNESEIRHILRLAGAKAILVESAADAAQLEKAAPELMGEMQVKMVVGAGTDAVPSTYLSLQTIASTAAEDESFQQTSDFLDHMPRHIDDVVFIWFTSGTTSLPKAAPHTNKSLTCNIRSWGEALDLDDTRAWLQILPMNSIVGSSWTLAYLISGGSITHVNYNFDVPAIAQAISAGENTDVLAVPSMIDLLAFSPLLKEPSNKGIDRLLVGGSKILRSHVEKAFEVIKCRRFSPFFGMTEGTSVCMETLYRVPSSLQDPIYAGYVNPGAKVRICAPEQTEPVPRGTPGELVQGGLQKIECYLGNQGQDNFFTDNGETWYRCGDQAVMSEDGRIAIVGRYKGWLLYRIVHIPT